MKALRMGLLLPLLAVAFIFMGAAKANATLHQTAGVWTTTTGGTSFLANINVTFTNSDPSTATGADFDFSTSVYTTISNDDDWTSVSNTKDGSGNWTSVITGYSQLTGGSYSNELVLTTLTCTKSHLGVVTVQLHIVDCNQSTGAPTSTVIFDSGTPGTPNNGGLSIN